MSRRMVKPIAFMMAVVFAVFLCACQKDNNTTSKNDNGTQNADTVEPLGEWSDGKKIVASLDRCFQWNDTKDTITGLTIDGQAMTEIVIPKECSVVDGDVFSLNEKIERVAFLNPDTKFGNEFTGFIRCSNLAEVIFPQNLESIPSYCCSGCERLTDIGWPKNLTTIESDAFNGCISLRKVHLPEYVTTIEAYAFHDCEYLSDLDLGSQLREIGYAAFEDCYSLAHVKLPYTVTSIDDEAFEGTIYVETAASDEADAIANGGDTDDGGKAETDEEVVETESYAEKTGDDNSSEADQSSEGQMSIPEL